MRAVAIAVLAWAAPAVADSQDRPPLRAAASNRDEAKRLERELRKPTDPSSPLNYIQLDVDVVEGGAPRMRMTRKQVAGLARTWGRMLVAPQRSDVICVARDRMTLCLQRDDPELYLAFCHHSDQPSTLVKVTVVRRDQRDQIADLFGLGERRCVP